MNPKQTFLAKPFDVLFFRDNKAFDFGEWYSEGIFPPYPSTFQGLIRTNILMQNKMIDNQGKLKNHNEAEKLVGNDLQFPFEIEGPFVSYDNQLYFPTPKDIIQVNKTKAKQSQLSSVTMQSDVGLDLFYSDHSVKEKFLHFSQSLLCMDLFNEYRRNGEIKDISREGPYEFEQRVGIKLDLDCIPPQKKNEEGHYYMTHFIRMHHNGSLFFSISGNGQFDFHNQYGRLGSEGRGVYFEKTGNLLSKIKLENKFYEELAKNRKFKIILLTHGIFKYGWLPFKKADNNIIEADFADKKILLKLIFAANDMPLRISGYSQLKQKKAGYGKAGRGYAVKKQVIAVPAGSVFYFDIPSQNIDEAILADWLKALDVSKIENGKYSSMGYNQIAIGKIK